MSKINGAKGFTLLETIIVVLVIGILAAMAVVRYTDLRPSATTAAKATTQGSVQSAWSVYVTQNKTNPTVTQLAAQVSGGTAATTGVQSSINGVTYTVLTYTDTGCTVATASTAAVVACIGNISP